MGVCGVRGCMGEPDMMPPGRDGASSTAFHGLTKPFAASSADGLGNPLTRSHPTQYE
jgi:hypothetical protein|eukprot:SAG25_NODE_25_length_21717_cov_29.421778_3_plen_57_part_00